MSSNALLLDLERRNLALTTHAEARQFAISRGLSADDIKTYMLGYEPTDSWSAYRGRLLFPLRDLYGRFVTNQARGFRGETPKYIHGSYDKQSHLYGLYEAREAIHNLKKVVVVEGPIDAIILTSMGYPSVALLGTAFSVKQALLLRRLCSSVVLWMDGDKAGNIATATIQDLLYKSAGFQRVDVAANRENDPSALITSGHESIIRSNLETYFSRQSQSD